MRERSSVVWLYSISGKLLADIGSSVGRDERIAPSRIRIDPEVVLFGFLPVLVFASGLNANVHIFFKVFSQCILLAGPGVALGAFLTAVIVKYVFNYGWGWNVSMVLGSRKLHDQPLITRAGLKP